MPMQQSLYPPDWPEIAFHEKCRAGWMCEECGADCIDDHPSTQRNKLTVHHLDHNPANCAPENLIALCSICHLRRDARWHARNAAIIRNIKMRGSMLPLPFPFDHTLCSLASNVK